MLPTYLSIEGLYSYQSKQEIDFTLLTEAGLFGIFGNVGSGKSSILEAISYALYGETERLNKQEKRSYNMMNLKSDQAIIDFQFLNFENRKFRFVVQWKRRKRFEDTSTIERTAYEWMANEWIPMESADGALVTNLSYPNFRRTIIIPQGQFKEFLELKGKDRSDMMKEIFFLNQYDLGPKVGYLQAENNKKVENLKGALTGFEQVTHAIKEQKSLELSNAKAELVAIKKDYEELTASYKKLMAAYENRQDLFAKENELTILNQKRSQIELYEKELHEFESVSLHFREPINKLNLISSTKEQLLSKIEKLQDSKDQLTTKIQAIQQQIDAIQPDYNNIENFNKQLAEYQLLLMNKDLVQSKTEKIDRIEKGTPFLLESQAKEQTLSKKLERAESDLELLKSKRINSTELLAIESWFNELDQILSKEKELSGKLISLEEEIKQHKDKFSANHVEENTWQETLNSLAENLGTEQKLIQEKEASIRVKQELSQYILNLHDGEACPLCGSPDHPHKMHTTDLSQEMEALESLQAKWKKSETDIRQLQNLLTSTAHILIDKRATRKTLEAELEQLSHKKANHHRLFQWNDFDSNQRELFENKKASVKQLENNINNKELEIKEIRKESEATKEKTLKYEKSIEGFKNEVLILESNIAQNNKQIQLLTHLIDTNLTKLELSMESSQTEEKLIRVEKQYKEWTELVNSLKNNLATVVGQFTETQEQFKSYNKQFQDIQSTLYSLLKKFNYADIAEVIFILDKSINTIAMKDSIQQFHIRYNSLAQRINELLVLTATDDFSHELFDKTKDLLQIKTQKLEAQISLTGSLEKELQTIIIELDKKTNLIKEFEKLNARKENLRTLDNMFKGNGFVNYVSSIHLERLCEIANNRFHRLTKNQLSLCINESNEFEVKDYLNNGYRRSIKTLSGGQSFQASLCLALALAENIQALNKADRNFFFIDEGFGTQDNESINTVFDTLQYLHQENRVVGIISHVEELKERMPRSVTVTKDMEKGSQVRYT